VSSKKNSPAAQRETLSESLNSLLEESATESVTLNELMGKTRGRGLYIVLILLSLPFITPIPLPGLSTVLGLTMAALAARLALGLPPRLPKFIGARKISRKRLRAMVGASARILRAIDQLAKPRHSGWLEWRTARLGNAMLLVLMGLFLAFPHPPVIPFSNSLPSWAVILLALAIMQRDGILVWVAYAVAVGTSIYLISFSVLAAAGMHHIFDLWWAS